MGFFVKKKIHKIIGYYNEELKYMADYDFIYKIIKKKTVCTVTKKSEVLGKFSKGGISEKINIFQKLFYESKVRLINKQNLFYVIILAVLHFVNYIINKLLNYFR